MKAQEIRESFLDFFAGKSHKVISSSSLLPKEDPTILFTNAGMNQFKNIFLGIEKRSYSRATSIQKCMRVSGKHNDLEQVGKTAKHHTFFEMLGNFSFGDYFKKEAIAFAWELVTEVFNLEKSRLYVTIYKEDEEAFRIWNGDIGLPSDRIFRFGKKDNFWAMGDTGPCGPCSEIHYDVDSSIEEEDPYTLIEQGSDRFLELWNLVFMQFSQDEKGKLHPLPSPSIDTGMGLERTAAALQGKRSNFDTDLFQPVIEQICDACVREYPSHDEGDISVRIIADHIRAISFLIGDGIMPSNEGRGYVLRRLIRRACRHGNLLGLEKPFLYTLVSAVSDIMKDAYPELVSSASYISRVCLSEEERFASTLSSGLRYFHQYIDEVQKSGEDIIPGEKAFKLYDTFGFPLDLTIELASEKKLLVDEEGFQEELKKQREQARLSWKGDLSQKEKKVYEGMEDFRIRFVGYEEEIVSEAKVLAIIKDGRRVSALAEGESGEVILDRTPFYAEAGGQVGDTGQIKNPHFAGLVENASFPIPDVISHRVKGLSGKLNIGDAVEAAFDIRRRKSIRANHTATHLLHASLKQILGDHVKQAGSLVSPERLRFDFTHFSPMTQEETRRVEALVNQKIRENLELKTKVTTLEEGLEAGATAIFEEKYGERVRLVRIEDFSKELCGGVHVRATGEIGLFKIIAESSVAAGMRRIEAVTGEEALNYVQELDGLLGEIQSSTNSSRKDVLLQVEKLMDSLKEKERENKLLRQKMASQTYLSTDQVSRRDIQGVPVIAQKVEGLNQTEMREMADSLKQKIGSGIVILGSAEENKAFLVVSVSKNLAGRVKADALIKEIAPLIGGGGGGRADFAQAGGTKPEELGKAFEKSWAVLEKLLSANAPSLGDEEGRKKNHL